MRPMEGIQTIKFVVHPSAALAAARGPTRSISPSVRTSRYEAAAWCPARRFCFKLGRAAQDAPAVSRSSVRASSGPFSVFS
jgi:hypothetical protein